MNLNIATKVFEIRYCWC